MTSFIIKKLTLIPGSFQMTDNLGLLVLRVFFGLSLFALHGLGKIANFSTVLAGFPDPVGIGAKASLVLAIFAETGAALFLVAGAFTRLAAAIAGFTMLVAFSGVHQCSLGAAPGELAFLYLGAFVVLMIAGGGCCSIDGWLRKRPAGGANPRDAKPA